MQENLTRYHCSNFQDNVFIIMPKISRESGGVNGKRMELDDDSVLESPVNSLHWKNLNHHNNQPQQQLNDIDIENNQSNNNNNNDNNDRLLNDRLLNPPTELIEYFRDEIKDFKNQNTNIKKSGGKPKAEIKKVKPCVSPTDKKWRI